MISERSQALKDRIYKYTSLKANKNQLVGFTTRRNELSQLKDELIGITQVATLLIKKGILSPSMLASTNQQVEIIKEIENDFNARPESIISSPKPLADCKKAVNQRIDDLKSNAEMSWQKYVQSVVPNHNDELLNVLKPIPGLNTIVDSISKLYRELEPFLTVPPQTAEEIVKFNELILLLPDLWNRLGSDKLPTKVIDFLTASITRQGATIDDLNDEVLKWISDHNIKSAFCIKVLG